MFASKNCVARPPSKARSGLRQFGTLYRWNAG